MVCPCFYGPAQCLVVAKRPLEGNPEHTLGTWHCYLQSLVGQERLWYSRPRGRFDFAPACWNASLPSLFHDPPRGSRASGKRIIYKQVVEGLVDLSSIQLPRLGATNSLFQLSLAQEVPRGGVGGGSKRRHTQTLFVAKARIFFELPRRLLQADP